MRIDEVLADLDAVIDTARAESSPLGYFAALYRRVTAKVREGIEAGVFDDGERMDELDFVFARRYLDALETWRAGERPTAAWALAFEAAHRWRPILLQHLVVGINAHINLDLGIAAARVCPGPRLAGLHDDFQRINTILASLVGVVQGQIGRASPWMGFLFKVAGEDGVRAVEFSMEVARDEAWRLAERLAFLPEPEQEAPIAERDRETTDLGRLVLHPGWLLDAANLLIRLREDQNVDRVIDILSEDPVGVEALLAMGE